MNILRTIDADDTIEDFIVKFNPPKNSVSKGPNRTPNRSPKNSNPQVSFHFAAVFYENYILK